MCFLLFSSAAFAENINFITLADIHFDPFIACAGVAPCPLIKKLENAKPTDWSAILHAADTSKPKYKLDTNYLLLTSVLSNADHVASAHEVQFGIVLGDELGHEFRQKYIQYTRDRSRAHYQLFVKKLLIFLNNAIGETFPDIDIFMVVGNNDAYAADYYTEIHSVFFTDMSSVWSSLIKTKAARNEMRETFPLAGYYAVDLPTQAPLRLIVINSVLFSYKAKGKSVPKAAADELSWLHEQLVLAKKRKQKVLIAMHIPSGIDVYATLRIRLFRLVDLWKTSYEKQFEAELAMFAPEIVGVFSGHLHSDWTRFLSLGKGKSVYMSGTPSISPIFGNNPGFKIYTYSTATQAIEQAKTHSQLLSSFH